MAHLILPLRRTLSSLARGGGACTPRGKTPARPPCVPCVPKPQPACRARNPPGRRGTRVVCCPPLPGVRPPCPQPAPAAPLTCRNISDQNCESPNPPVCPPGGQPSVNPPSGWVCDQDPVARRLQAAQCVRRAQYEKEVADRAVRRPPPPSCPATYVLGGERECARATDGCTYAVLPTRCGPGRIPPPPRCVELAPDDACRVSNDVPVDPCAHRPRVMIEIDRSTSQSPACPPAPGPTPGPATPRSQRANIIDRLRGHIPGCQSERRIHTSSALFKAKMSSESVTGGLEGMLRSKKQLKETGRGRFVSDENACPVKCPDKTGGRLNLSVPPGTCRVHVHVSLLPEPPKAKSSPAGSAPGNAPLSSSACNNFSSTSEKRNPCLSISQIRKKWTGQSDQKSARAQCVDLGYAKTNQPVQGLAAKPSGPTASPCGPTAKPSRPAGSPCGPTAKPSHPAGSPCDPAAKPICPAAPPCGPTVSPRSKPGAAPTKPSNEPSTKTKRCSSTSAFIANTVLAHS